MLPIPPREEGEFTTTRPALIVSPNSRIAASSCEKMEAVCPSPPKWVSSVQRFTPARKVSTT